MCVWWLIISFYDLTLYLWRVSDYFKKHYHILLCGCWISRLLLLCLLFLLHLDNGKINAIDSNISMQEFPWIILSVFLKQGYAFIRGNDSLPYKLCKTSSSFLPSCNQYLALIFNRRLHFNAYFLQGPELLFPVVLSNYLSPWWVIQTLQLTTSIPF